MYFNKIVCFTFLVFTVMILESCGPGREALGADNEIRIICSELDKPIIREYLRLIFTDTLFSPEPEPYYHLKFSDAMTYNDLKNHSQIIIAAVARDPGNPGYQLVKQMLPSAQFKEMETGDPVILSKNVNALNQLFLVINASSRDQLFATVETKKNFIRKKFHEQFVDRQSRYIFGSDRNKKLEDSLKTEFGWSMKIPWGWTTIRASSDSNFVWIGKEMPFQWISIGWEDGNFVNNELQAGDYIWAWPKSHYGIIQINEHKFKLSNTPYGKTNAFRAEGLWETIDLKESKGGPFRSYIFYDEKSDRTYHLNFLIHHPGNDKSIYMKQMDLIVRSFLVESS